MSVAPLHQVLADNRYPGRGVLWARTLDGALHGGYFLTGRSAASQARRLLRQDAELIVAATGAAAHDPLRHYVAACERGGWLVFGNGEQVAAVADRLEAGQPPAAALDGLDYEPDPPIFTPRITVATDLHAARGAWFGAARRSRGARTATDVLMLAVRDLEPGDVVMMTTYRCDGHDIATGEPFVDTRTAAADREALLAEVWDALTPQLRVAAAVFTPGQLADAAIRTAIP
ncbi:IMP cyclohydrolase [Frankia gtarii]|uniref:IMP cyclohydrolase n=1 Tax=Frankia gtarii TaxID=2950102 RepID=UPI0021BF57E2|nr:IMP cyclohydrolase [Frankia gtarii]